LSVLNGGGAAAAVPRIGGGEDWKGLLANSSEVVRWHYQLVGGG